MRILLDTHTFLWFFSDPFRLSKSATELLELDSSDPLISIGSLWEMSIKNSLGKLDLSVSFASIRSVLSLNEIAILPIDFEHTLRYNQLPYHHRDPFDRMLAAQALVEQIDLVSADAVFDSYFQGSGVKRIW